MAAKKPPVSKKKKDPLSKPGAPEKPYRTIFEHAGLPTIIIEKDSTISLVNNAFLKMSGFRRKEIVGKKKWMEFVAPEDIEKLTKYLSGNTKKNRWQLNLILLDLLTRKNRTTTSYLLRG